MKRSYYIQTLGCQMNYSDSERIDRVLQNLGLAKVDTMADADLVIFNTCSIRQKGEDRVFGQMVNIKRLRKTKPHLLAAITGCMTRITSVREDEERDKLLRRAPETDFIFRIEDIPKLPEIIHTPENEDIVDQVDVDSKIGPNKKVNYGIPDYIVIKYDRDELDFPLLAYNALHDKRHMELDSLNNNSNIPDEAYNIGYQSTPRENTSMGLIGKGNISNFHRYPLVTDQKGGAINFFSLGNPNFIQFRISDPGVTAHSFNSYLYSTDDLQGKLEAQYTKFKLKDRILDEPFIVRKIGQKWGVDFDRNNDSWISKALDASFGGILTKIHRVGVDALRIGKLILNPRGLMWMIKQQGLHLTNPKTEVTPFTPNRPSRYFNPVKFLTNIITSPFDFKVERHGISVIPGVFSTYEDVQRQKKSLGEIEFVTDVNRLLLLQKERFEGLKKYDSVGAIAIQQAIVDAGGGMLSGQGGPNSFFGIGITLIRRSTIGQGNNNVLSWKGIDGSTIRIKKVPTKGLFVTHLLGPLEPIREAYSNDFQYINTGNILDQISNLPDPSNQRGQEGGDNAQTSTKQEKWVGTGRQEYSKLRKYYEDKLQNDKFGPGDVEFTTKTNRILPLGNRLKGVNRVYDAVMTFSEETKGASFIDDAKIPDVESLKSLHKSKHIDGDYVDVNLHRKYAIPDSGRFAGTDSTKDGIMEGIEDPKDFIDFILGGIRFRAIVSGISKKYAPEWASEKYIGRPTPIFRYSGYLDTVSFNFLVVCETKSHLEKMYKKLDDLKRLTRPLGTSEKRMIGPLTRLTLGNVANGTGYIGSH